MEEGAHLWQPMTIKKTQDFNSMSKVSCMWHIAYDEDYVSKYRFYLSNAKLDFTYLDGKKRKNQSRAVFDSYPIYLQQTLFYDSDDLRRIRTLECCSRIEAYEELREKGNR